jgi:hypothetical protein
VTNTPTDRDQSGNHVALIRYEVDLIFRIAKRLLHCCYGVTQRTIIRLQHDYAAATGAIVNRIIILSAGFAEKLGGRSAFFGRKEVFVAAASLQRKDAVILLD